MPWVLLASINKFETGFGTNLSVSSAGAVGWMQFLPSTWKRYAVDASGDGKADPYSPRDAINAAARYLKAAGVRKNLSAAVWSYNHSVPYVNTVIAQARLYAKSPLGDTSGPARPIETRVMKRGSRRSRGCYPRADGSGGLRSR